MYLLYSTKQKRSYKDGIVAILHIQNSIILMQTTEYNNFMLEGEQYCLMIYY